MHRFSYIAVLAFYTFSAIQFFSSKCDFYQYFSIIQSAFVEIVALIIQYIINAIGFQVEKCTFLKRQCHEKSFQTETVGV